VIGLVGGVASGKSMVAAQFEKLGCRVVDADRIAHELLREGAIRQALRNRFGDGILDPSGEIDRRLLAERVFASTEDREALESVVHPEIERRVAEALEAGRRSDAPAVVLDAPLILEKGLDRLCQVVVYIKTPEEVRRSRAGVSRGWEESEVARREANQISLKVKQDRADFIIDNSTSPEHTFEQVRTILSRIAK
jgi:dephospho-CoA kinase